MANNQSNLHTQVQEYQRPNRNELNQVAVEEKTITNIYYDCLERIFEFLDLESLLNLAQTCKRLQIAAAAKFSDVYGKKCFIIDPRNIPMISKPFEFFFDERYTPPYLNIIKVQGLQLCLSFLRCFGSKSLHLQVILQRENSYIDQYIDKYCADTVNRIRFDNQRRFLFTKPFKNVEKLHLYNTLCLGNELPKLVKWFPKLRNLKLETVYKNSGSFGVFFPQLEEVSLSIDANYIYRTSEYQAITDPNARDKLTTLNVKDFLRANQQLSYVAIKSYDTELPITTILNLISGNPSILTLHALSKSTDITMDEIERLTSEHRCIEHLYLEGYPLTCADVIFIIRQLNSLKKIHTVMKSRLEYDRFMNQKGEEWKSERLHPVFEDISYTGRIYVRLNAENQ